jgi:uncharacterized delta-60 repeat protein
MKNRLTTQALYLRAMAFTIILALFVTTGAWAAAGVLDPTFDGDGIVLTDIGGDDFAFTMEIQPDGKIVVGGSTNKLGGKDFALTRYNMDGTLDPSFDGDGIVITDISSRSDEGRSVRLQSDGKIVMGGYSCIAATEDCDFALARYNADGSLDVSFGVDGIVLTDFDGAASAISAIAIQPDGKIVAVGDSSNSSSDEYALARYNDDGSLDTGFDSDGKVTFGIGLADYPSDMVLQPDRKIIVVGASDIDPSYGVFRMSAARLNDDGSLDPSFDGDGKLIVNLDGDRAASAVALQANGKILIAGRKFINYSNEGGDFSMVRVNADGALDATFGDGGFVNTDFYYSNEEGSRAIAIQNDGKIVLAGSAGKGGTLELALARYHSNGSLDTSFSGDGKVSTSVQDYDGASDIRLQSDGKIVVAGTSDAAGAGYIDFVLARYDEGGLAFSSNGSRDGWILESSETSNAGGSMNNAATILNVGDGWMDAQYRSIVAFNATLPADAVITKVTLKIKANGALVGNNNPFTWGNGLKVDVCNGSFGAAPLQLSDFNFNNSTKCLLNAGTFNPTPTAGWYSANIVKAAWNKINPSGSTQFRLRFAKDDNDDKLADYWRFYSGNHGNINLRPTLVIDYNVP